MKRTLLLVCALTLSTTIFAQTSICPSFFTRNNGNGGGCDGKLTFVFATCPDPVLTIDSVYANGKRLNVTVGAGTCTNGKATYCFIGENIPPSGGLRVYFSQNGVAGSGFNCYVVEAAGPTPVKLSLFEAKKYNNAVLINWITESEVNHDRFEIERSFDNVTFKTLALVLDGISTGSNTKKYAYKDGSAEVNNHSVIYYRLKQIDKDGTATYSDIRVVRSGSSIATMEVSPNPFTNNVTIKFASEEKGTAEVRLVSVLGARAMTATLIAEKGMNTISMNNLSKLSSGMYLAIVTVNGKVISKQQVIK